MPSKNPATKGGAHSVGDLLGGDLEQNKPSSFTLQVSRLVSRFGLPTATAAVIAELAFIVEAR
jgi:hypothetical protein